MNSGVVEAPKWIRDDVRGAVFLIRARVLDRDAEAGAAQVGDDGGGVHPCGARRDGTNEHDPQSPAAFPALWHGRRG